MPDIDKLVEVQSRVSVEDLEVLESWAVHREQVARNKALDEAAAEAAIRCQTSARAILALKTPAALAT